MVNNSKELRKDCEEALHDLNNHLAAINGFALMLSKKLQMLPVEKDYADKILRSGEEALKINHILKENMKKHFDDGQ